MRTNGRPRSTDPRVHGVRANFTETELIAAKRRAAELGLEFGVYLRQCALGLSPAACGIRRGE